MSIIDFLTAGGVFVSLKDLIENIIEWVIIFVSNTTYKFFEPLINLVISAIPIFDNLKFYLQYVFNLVSPYIYFILDASFISKPLLIYLILSIVFRVLIKLNTYLVKLLLNWYKALVP